MSDEILASVTSERVKYTALSELNAVAKMTNSVTPSIPCGVSFPTAYDVVACDETSQAKADSVFVHRMPSTHWTVDSFLVIRMNAPSAGTTAPRVGGNIIKRIVVRNGSTVQEYEYQPVLAYVLARSTPSERQQILSMLGGSASTAETVVVPLLCFWTPLGSGSPAKNNPGIPNFIFNSPVEIEVTLSPASELLAAGGAFAANAYDSVRVCHLQKKSTTNIYQQVRASGDFSLWSYDYQTSTSRTVLPSGADTRTDLSYLDGSSCGLFLSPVLTTSITGNDLYAHTAGITRIRTELNGAEFLRLEQNIDPTTAERVLEWLSYSFGACNGIDGGDASLAHHCRFIPFGAALSAGDGDRLGDNTISNTGGANLRDFTKIDTIVRNDSGAEIQTHWLNIRLANYYSKNGQLFRRK